MIKAPKPWSGYLPARHHVMLGMRGAGKKPDIEEEGGDREDYRISDEARINGSRRRPK